VIGDNLQTAVDTEPHLIVVHDATNKGSDGSAAGNTKRGWKLFNSVSTKTQPGQKE